MAITSQTAAGFRVNILLFQTEQEFVDMYQSVQQYQPANFTALNEKYGNKFKLFEKRAPAYTLPAELDWRTSGAVTMVKDQVGYMCVRDVWYCAYQCNV